jgi:hypothetical protein
MSTPLAVFGPGILIGSRTDITPNPPINVGFVQEFSIELAATTKSLYGQFQYPLVAARATIKATGKFKNATVSGAALNNLFYGMTISTANIAWQVTNGGGSTFTVSSGSTQIQIGSSLTFDADLGVTYANSTASGAPGGGLPLQRVSSGNEAAGKYSVTIGSPGLYNFSTADVYSTAAGGTGPLNIKVLYTQSTTGGQVIPVTNQLIGTTPTFQLDYYTNLNQPSAKPMAVRIFSCISEKLAMQFKLEDFMIPEIDFALFANSNGQIFNKYLPEIS